MATVNDLIAERIAAARRRIEATRAHRTALAEARRAGIATRHETKIARTQPQEGEPDMANDTTITIIGNLTADPELRFTQAGAPVANFTIASTPRTYDKQTNQWKDGEPLFLRASIWRQPAEHVAETLTKGMRVIATGRLKQRSYETAGGEKRSVIELEVDEIGPSLQFATAKVTRATSNNGGGQAQQGGGWGGQQQPANAPTGGGWGQQGATASGAAGEEPPF